MKIITVIPARGGSKRFPQKNIHLLNGKPLISYPIMAAGNAESVDRIVVSTDDKEIADIAKSYGAEVPFFRPAALAADDSPVVDSIIYTVKKLEKDQGYHPDYILLLQAATPLIESGQIEKAIHIANKNKADSVVTVCPVNTINHPFNIRRINKDQTISFWLDELHYQYLQKTKPQFYHAANLWLTSYDNLIREKKLEGRRNYPLVIPAVYSLDIDYREDLDLIEAWLQYNHQNGFSKRRMNFADTHTGR